MIKRTIATALLLFALTSCAITGTGTGSASGSGGTSRLEAVLASMTDENGVHMNYDVTIDNIDATTTNDVHARGDKYYLRAWVGKKSDLDTVQYGDGDEMMTLDISTKTATVFEKTEARKGKEGIELNELYQYLAMLAGSEYSESSEKIGDGEYICQTYPAADNTVTEKKLYFDGDGNLVRFVSAADEKQNIPGMIYDINGMDDEADESVFDISAYDIERN